MVFQTLKVFDNSIDAYILKSRLENDGIACFIFDEHVITQDPLLNYAVGGIKLKVYAEDYEKAKAVLKEIHETPYLNEVEQIIECPKCNSTEITSGFRSMKGLRGILSIFVSFFFLIFPIYANPVYKCNMCGAEFKTK